VLFQLVVDLSYSMQTVLYNRSKTHRSKWAKAYSACVRAGTDLYPNRLNGRLDLFAQHASDARLELAILDGVDERVDAAVHKRHHYHEVIEQATDGGNVVDSHHEGVDSIWCPAYDESAADHQ